MLVKFSMPKLKLKLTTSAQGRTFRSHLYFQLELALFHLQLTLARGEFKSHLHAFKSRSKLATPMSVDPATENSETRHGKSESLESHDMVKAKVSDGRGPVNNKGPETALSTSTANLRSSAVSGPQTVSGSLPQKSSEELLLPTSTSITTFVNRSKAAMTADIQVSQSSCNFALFAQKSITNSTSITGVSSRRLLTGIVLTVAMEPKEGFDCFGYAAHDSKGVLVPFKFKRRTSGPDDVVFRVTHCGICYAEVVWTKNFLGDVMYPVVPGHEIVGVVTKVGSNVTKYKPGDRVGMGYCAKMCEECDSCKGGIDGCTNHPTRSFNDVDVDGSITRGGFSNLMQADQRYVVRIPDSLPSDVAAPLLCAGITVYTPMIRHGMDQPGKRLGVIGLGGVGHMAVKFGKAFGLHVTVFSTSLSKREEALGALGADAFVVSRDEEAMKAHANTLDFIINAAAAEIPLDPYLLALKPNGVLVLVGAAKELKFSPFQLFNRKYITGSGGGGMKLMQEMLDFCGDKGVAPMIETVDIQYVNTAIERMMKNDVHYRFVVDVEKSLKPE